MSKPRSHGPRRTVHHVLLVCYQKHLVYVSIHGLRSSLPPLFTSSPAKTAPTCQRSSQEPPSHRPTRRRPRLHRSLYSVLSTASAENSFWSSTEHWTSYRGESEHLHHSQSLSGGSLKILDSRTDGTYIVRCKDGKDLPLQAARKFKLNAEAGKQCFVKRYVSSSLDVRTREADQRPSTILFFRLHGIRVTEKIHHI